MRGVLAFLGLATFVVACASASSDEPVGQAGEAWTSGTPACGATLGSWSGVNAYSNGKCFGNVSCTNCDGAGFTVHTSSSNGQTAYGGAWQCVELITRTFDTKYKIWLSNNAGTPLCNSANGTAGLTVYGPGYHDSSPPKPVAGDAVVWNYNGGIGHVALVTGGTSTTVTYLQQNWGSPTGYAATGTTSWNGSNFGAPSDSTGGFTPACWIHANANSTGTCVYGNGLYCGGNGVSGDPSTLYDCQNGVLAIDQVCSFGCEHMANYVNDQCYPCPNGDGVSCSENTLYSCKAGSLTPAETCPYGCANGACLSDATATKPPAAAVPTASSQPPQQPPSDPAPTDSGGCTTSPASPTVGGFGLFLALLLLRRRLDRRSV